jgi:hypothetical protein
MGPFTALEEQIRECFGRVVYTHKTHEKMAGDCARTLRGYKYCQILASSLTAAGAISAVFTDKFWVKTMTAIISIFTAWLAGYLKNFDPGGTAQKHRDAAASLWDIRESYLSLLTDLRTKSIDDKEAVKRRDALQAKLAAIYKSAPQTNGKAYGAAQKALKKNEEYTFSAAEIDKFVPDALRKNKEC